MPRYLKQRVQLWQGRALLDNWDISVSMQSLRNEHAKTLWPKGSHRADIVFCATEYDEWDYDYLDLLICHELYHILTAHTYDTIFDYVGGEGKVYTAYNRADEAAADAFALVLVKAYKRKRS